VFVGSGDKVGNLKRGGSLEKDKPIPWSEDPEGQPDTQRFGAGLKVKPVRGVFAKANARRRGRNP
jgi:hypothetical protein